MRLTDSHGRKLKLRQQALATRPGGGSQMAPSGARNRPPRARAGAPDGARKRPWLALDIRARPGLTLALIPGAADLRARLEGPSKEQVERVLPLVIEPGGQVHRPKKRVEPREHARIVPQATE